MRLCHMKCEGGCHSCLDLSTIGLCPVSEWFQVVATSSYSYLEVVNVDKRHWVVRVGGREREGPHRGHTGVHRSTQEHTGCQPCKLS